MLTRAAICASLMAMSSGLAAIASPSFAANTPSSNPPASAPFLVTRRVQKDLASRLNVPFHTLEIVEATREVWPDSCLGLSRPTERCQGGNARGWQVRVRSAQQVWTYRSDRAAMRLRMALTEKNSAIAEPLSTVPFTVPSTAPFTVEISQKLLAVVSQHTQEPIDNLQVLAVQTAKWDSCAAAATSDTSCMPTEEEGFRVIVGSGPRELSRELSRRDYERYLETGEIDSVPKEWVYSVSADGASVLENEIASNIQPWVGTYFASHRSNYPKLSEDTVIQAIYDSNFGFINATTLTTDGKVTFTRTYYFPEDGADVEEVLTQLSPEEVAEIRTLLQQQQFSALDGMVYANEDPGLTTEGSVSIRTLDASVGYSADEEALSPQMQAVLRALAPFMW